MTYTLLVRNSGSVAPEVIYVHRAPGVASPQLAVQEYLNEYPGGVPLAWCEGYPTVPWFNRQAERRALVDQWIAEGRGIDWSGVARAYLAKVPVRGVINQGSAPKEVTNPNAGMILRDTAKRPPLDWNTSTPFNPFKDFVVTHSEAMDVRSNGREFGRFVLPDTQPTGNLVDPSFAMAAERSR